MSINIGTSGLVSAPMELLQLGSGSSGTGVAGGVRAAGAVLQALLHGPGNSLVMSLNVSVSRVSTGSGAVSLPMQPSSVQRLEEPLRAQREPLLSAALGT